MLACVHVQRLVDKTTSVFNVINVCLFRRLLIAVIIIRTGCNSKPKVANNMQKITFPLQILPVNNNYSINFDHCMQQI